MERILTLGNKTYPLKLTFLSLARMEREIGIKTPLLIYNLCSIESPKDFIEKQGALELLGLLYAALEGGRDPRLRSAPFTADDAGRIAELAGGFSRNLGALLGEVLVDFLPKYSEAFRKAESEELDPNGSRTGTSTLTDSSSSG